MRAWFIFLSPLFFFSLISRADGVSDVSKHLNDLYESQVDLVNAIKTANDANAEWNKNQAVVKTAVQHILNELQTAASKGEPRYAERMAAYNNLKQLDADRAIRSLRDFEEFTRKIGQVLLPGENAGKYKDQFEINEVRNKFAGLYHANKDKQVEVDRAGKVTVQKGSNNKAVADFTPKAPINTTPFESMATKIKSVQEAKAAAEKVCPSPVKMSAKRTELAKDKATLEGQIKDSMANGKADVAKQQAAEKRLEEIQAEFAKSLKKVFTVKATGPTTFSVKNKSKLGPAWLSEPKTVPGNPYNGLGKDEIQDRLFQKIAASFISPRFNMSGLSAKVNAIHPYPISYSGGGSGISAPAPGSRQHRAEVTKHNESVAKFIKDLREKSEDDGGTRTTTAGFIHLLAQLGANAEVTGIDRSAFREFERLYHSYREEILRSHGAVTRTVTNQHTASVQVPQWQQRITAIDAEVAHLQFCLTQITTAEQAVLKSRFQSRGGIDADSATHLDAAKNSYLEIVRRQQAK